MKVLVSLTTWKKRVDQAHLTIESILNQTRKPDIVEVNLDRENFPNGMDDLPESLKKLEKEGVKFYFGEKDLHCWEKLLPTWRRHRDDEEDWLNITLDDDVEYSHEYVEQTEKNMTGCDYLCTQSDTLTHGQFMAYRGKFVSQFVDLINDELVLDCTLDDYVIYWVIQQYTHVRGKKIDSVPISRETGYSFRRTFYTDQDPSKLRGGDYPFEEILREREVLRKIGLKIP